MEEDKDHQKFPSTGFGEVSRGFVLFSRPLYFLSLSVAALRGEVKVRACMLSCGAISDVVPSQDTW